MGRGAGAAGSGEPQTGVCEEGHLCNTILRLAAEKNASRRWSYLN